MTATTGIRIPSLNPYWDDSTGPPINFKIWRTLFTSWLNLQNDTLTAKDRNHLLFLTLGTEGQKIFQSNPAVQQINTMGSEDFLTAVNDTFETTINPVRAHYDLFNRKQHQTESINEYISALRSIVADCTFCEDCKQLSLATMVVIGCRDRKTQEKLLAKTKLEFDTFYQMLKAAESAHSDQSHILPSMSVNKTRVNYTKQQKSNTHQLPVERQNTNQINRRYKNAQTYGKPNNTGECIDYDMFSKDDSIGKITLTASDLTQLCRQSNPTWHALQGVGHGEVQLQFETKVVIGTHKLSASEVMASMVPPQTIQTTSPTEEGTTKLECEECLGDATPQSQTSNVEGPVRVAVMQARNLIAADITGKSDPYCVCKIAGKRIFKSKKMRNTLDPIWNEHFEIKKLKHDDVVEIECVDYDFFGKDDSIGAVTFTTLDITKLCIHSDPVWHTLRGVDRGEIQLQFETVKKKKTK